MSGRQRLPACLAVITAVAALATPAGPARADEPLWELGLGAGGLRLPHYRGSDQAYDLLLPVPYFVYRGQFLRATREGARAVLLDSDRVDFDVSLAATAPLKSSDNRARAGMPDLPATLELGPNLNATLLRGATWKLDLRLPARAGFTLEGQPRPIGWTLGPLVNLDVRWQGWNLGAQAGPVYGTRRFHAFFYDVDPGLETAQRQRYSSRSGYGGWRWTLAASRRMGPAWVGAFVRQDSVAGAVFEPSPLVRQRQQISVGLAMSWVLAVSDERVAVED